MKNYDLRDTPESYAIYALNRFKGEIYIKHDIPLEVGDHLLIDDAHGNAWLLQVYGILEYSDGRKWLDVKTITSQGAEFNKVVDDLMTKFDWNWSKYYPKRDVSSWNELAQQFISDYKELMNNYDEKEGKPGSRNSEELMEFFELCVKHPDSRFFQTLIFMIKRDLYVMDKNPDSTPGLELPGRYHSTFAWEKDSYERHRES